jgi:hypothetical protein
LFLHSGLVKSARIEASVRDAGEAIAADRLVIVQPGCYFITRLSIAERRPRRDVVRDERSRDETDSRLEFG